MRTKLDRTNIPSEIFEVDRGENITFISMVDDDKGQPQLTFSITLKQDLSFQMWSNEDEIPVNKVIHLCPFGKVGSCGELLNILAFVKSFMAEQRERVDNNKCLIAECISLLDKVEPKDGNDGNKKVLFIKEQLQYILQKQTKYTPQMLAMAAMWHMTSPVLYRTILEEEILTMPTERYVSLQQEY